jgi:hypothetical protein
MTVKDVPWIMGCVPWMMGCVLTWYVVLSMFILGFAALFAYALVAELGGAVIRRHPPSLELASARQIAARICSDPA